jgi:hypothetical protein
MLLTSELRNDKRNQARKREKDKGKQGRQEYGFMKIMDGGMAKTNRVKGEVEGEGKGRKEGRKWAGKEGGVRKNYLKCSGSRSNSNYYAPYCTYL